MKKYVLGFYFYPDPPCKVVLIQKNKPAWQKGFWNGVGGSIEEGESPTQAMHREFQEETGARVFNWRSFTVLSGADYRVYCFSAMGQEDVRTMTKETVGTFRVGHLPFLLLSNLEYLIPMALDLNLQSSILSYENP